MLAGKGLNIEIITHKCYICVSIDCTAFVQLKLIVTMKVETEGCWMKHEWEKAVVKWPEGIVYVKNLRSSAKPYTSINITKAWKK